MERKEKLTLRKYRSSDLDRLCELFIDKDVLDSLSGLLTLKNINKKNETKWLKEALKKYREKKPSRLDWVIEVNGVYVGGIGAQEINWDNQNTEIGYWIGKPYWGKGYATEAVKQVAQILFNKYKFVRISAKAFADNMASQRVLEKAGFKYEGTLRKNAKRKNKFVDDKLYAIVR